MPQWKERRLNDKKQIIFQQRQTIYQASNILTHFSSSFTDRRRALLDWGVEKHLHQSIECYLLIQILPLVYLHMYIARQHVSRTYETLYTYKHSFLGTSKALLKSLRSTQCSCVATLTNVPFLSLITICHGFDHSIQIDQHCDHNKLVLVQLKIQKQGRDDVWVK